jgi:hypothetical protein
LWIFGLGLDSGFLFYWISGFFRDSERVVNIRLSLDNQINNAKINLVFSFA